MQFIQHDTCRDTDETFNEDIGGVLHHTSLLLEVTLDLAKQKNIVYLIVEANRI